LVDLEGLRGKGLIKKVKEEIIIHLDAMKRMDNFYRQNPPREDINLINILQEISDDYLFISRENRQKEKEIKELKEVIKTFENFAIQTKDEFLLDKIDNKRNQLEQIKTSLRSRLNESWHESLEDVLEAQKAFVKNDNDFVRSQIAKFKQRLLSNEQINQNELQEICQVQAELSFLELKLEQERVFQTQIEIGKN